MAKRRDSSKTGNGASLGFEEKLWAAADKLRGHMDAAEYKHVVLGLVFLKYISDAFQDPPHLGPATAPPSILQSPNSPTVVTLRGSLQPVLSIMAAPRCDKTLCVLNVGTRWALVAGFELTGLDFPSAGFVFAPWCLACGSWPDRHRMGFAEGTMLGLHRENEDAEASSVSVFDHTLVGGASWRGESHDRGT